MTVVAWDGTTLAADRRGTASGLAFGIQKIWRLDENRLVGVSGHYARAVEIVEWLRTGGAAADFPKVDGEQWVGVLVVHRDGRIEKYEDRGTPWVIQEPYHAIGSGRDYAMATMYLGHEAEEAVRVASALCVDCGNGIDTLTFTE